MRNHSIPVCYFPSTVLFVDDSRDFLLNFVLQLDEGLAYRIFDSPFDALALVRASQCEVEQISKRCLSEYTNSEHCPMTNNTVNVNLATIHGEIYNPQRFAEISVVVVDYDMPGMNGLDFCERMEDSAVKKILLTGQADDKIAIQAFNDGLIDKYIKKSSPNVAQIITDSIGELQQRYFDDMSRIITRMLSVSSPSCLKDKTFQSFFRNMFNKKAGVEYYLMDNSGSFLFVDEEGVCSCLVVKNETDLKLYYDLALDHGLTSETLAELKAGGRIPVFGVGQELPEWSDWVGCLIPAEKLVGDEAYYYAYIQDASLFGIQTNKILAYGDYLNEVDAEEMLLA